MKTWSREPLCRVRLRPRYLAHLTGVSYSTAKNWLYGYSKPCKLLTNSANILCAAAQKALDENLLPLDEPSMLPEERDVLTMNILRQLIYEVEDETTPE